MLTVSQHEEMNMLSNEYKKGKTKIEEPVIVGVAHSHSGGYYQEGCGGCQYEDKSNTIKPSQDKTQATKMCECEKYKEELGQYKHLHWCPLFDGKSSQDKTVEKQWIRGNCPYCDAERETVSTGWGMSPEGWEQMRKKHEEH